MYAEDSTANNRTDSNEDSAKRFKCNVCAYSTNHSGHFKQHYLIHSDERPYKCEICERGFTVRRNLQRHMLIHTGEKPYMCEFCHIRFRQLGQYKLHMSKH